MRHVDEELLAGLALGEPDRLALRDRAHLLVCRTCAARLGDLQALVATGRSEQPVPIQVPGPGLLASIRAELAGDSPAGAASRPTVLPAPTPLPDRRPARRPATSSTRRPLAAAAVCVVAVGGAVWFRTAEADVVVARTTLAPLPDRSGGGSAQLTERAGDLRLTIDVTRPATADAFEELWLINTDGRRMISLGVVPATGRATYPVAGSAGGLDGYTIVDISLEPFDGNAAHSRDSLLRGTLR